MRHALRAAQIEPFHVMDVLARAQALEALGRRVIHMEIGEPDFGAPEPVVEAGTRAMRDGLSTYTATLGLPALREAISGFYAAKFGIAVDSANVAVTAGASAGLLLALASLIDPGDEVLVADPGYPGYRHFVRCFEGRAIAIPVTAETSFQPTLEMVKQSWTPRTRCLLLGSPSNPTGTVIAPMELERISAFIAEREGVLIVDEIYQGLVYDQQPSTALRLPGDVVVVNSFSKYFCMTGWRLGWVVLPAARVRAFEKLAQHLFICAPTIGQHAALAAFGPESIDILELRRDEFRRRRDFLVPALDDLGLKVAAKPSGAFYVYANCSRFGEAGSFAVELLEQSGVAATPGLDFGSHGTRDHIRLAYTRGMADLKEAIDRIGSFCASRR